MPFTNQLTMIYKTVKDLALALGFQYDTSHAGFMATIEQCLVSNPVLLQNEKLEEDLEEIRQFYGQLTLAVYQRI